MPASFNSVQRTTRQLLVAWAVLPGVAACESGIVAPVAGTWPAATPLASVRQLPFHGTIHGHFTSAPTTDPFLWAGGAVATGRGTHIGAFRKVTQDITHIGTWQVDGSFVMTVANGDELHGSYTGFTQLAVEDGTLSWTLDAIISGGTGRFAAATGTFVFVAHGSWTFTEAGTAGVYSETFRGTIRY